MKSYLKKNNRPSECIWSKMLPSVTGVEKKNAHSFEQVTYSVFYVCFNSSEQLDVGGLLLLSGGNQAQGG